MRDTTIDLNAVVMSVYDSDGYLGIQIDAEGSEAQGAGTNAGTPTPGAGGVADYEAIWPGGLVHRPVDPVVDPNGTVHASLASTALRVSSGGRSWVMPLTDPRLVAILPELNKGDTMVYSGCGAFHRIGAEGQHSFFTTSDGTPNGQSIAALFWPTKFQMYAPWGKWTLDPTGYHVLTASGARLDIGG